ncbi:hypothetical protein DPMN_152379 [Dreissena polymorpha]|uniref:Uncharacterized protein n=1 Tax=Dreissena polymorpha TaxID=45954 RepID=A0A9D4FL60_DREPO|nr:hypothetical protein DPMN_152379 [Dreissena polymorpha]
MVLYTSFPCKENIICNPVRYTGVSNACLVQRNELSVTLPISDGRSHVKKTWDTFFEHKLRFPEKKRYLPIRVRDELGVVNSKEISSIEAVQRPNDTNASDNGEEAMSKKALSANDGDNLSEMFDRIAVTVEKETDRNNNQGAANNDSKLTTADNLGEYARKQIEELDEFLKTVDAILTENNVKPIVYKDTSVDDLLAEINAVLQENDIKSFDDSANNATLAQIATEINVNVSDLFPSVNQTEKTFSNEASQAKDLLDDDVVSSCSESLDSLNSNSNNSGYSTGHRKRKRNDMNACLTDRDLKKRKFTYDPVTFDVDKKRSTVTILLETNCKSQQQVKLPEKRVALRGETTLSSETTLPKKRKFSFQPVSFP